MDDQKCDLFEGNYYLDGYLLKEVTVGTVVKQCGEDEPPTLDELQRFRNRAKQTNDGNDSDEENEGSMRAKSLLDELSDLQGQTNAHASGSANKVFFYLLGSNMVRYKMEEDR